MITLATLPEATEQQIFDQVANHLLMQGCKSERNRTSEDSYACLYRGPNNTKCAAGILISDEEYKDTMEFNPWYDLTEQGVVPEAHSQLIRELQRVHDSFEVREWTRELQKIANSHGLTFNKPVV